MTPLTCKYLLVAACVRFSCFSSAVWCWSYAALATGIAKLQHAWSACTGISVCFAVNTLHQPSSLLTALLLLLIALFLNNSMGPVRVEFTQFTAPGLVLAACCILTAALLQWVFTDSAAPVKKKKKAADATATSTTSSSAPGSTPPRGTAASSSSCTGSAAAACIARVPGLGWVRPLTKFEVAIFGGFLLNVSTKGTIACYETLGANYAITGTALSPTATTVAAATASVLVLLLSYFRYSYSAPFMLVAYSKSLAMSLALRSCCLRSVTRATAREHCLTSVVCLLLPRCTALQYTYSL
jgi:hypothetical protein